MLETLNIDRGFIAFAITVMLFLVLLPLATRFGLLDYPAGRKDHASPTPVIGGLAIVLGIIITRFLTDDDSYMFLGSFMSAASVLLVVGHLDDHYDLRWYVRIGAQALAALIMI